MSDGRSGQGAAHPVVDETLQLAGPQERPSQGVGYYLFSGNDVLASLLCGRFLRVLSQVAGGRAGSSFKTSTTPSEESEVCLPGQEDVGMKERRPGSWGPQWRWPCRAPGPAPGSCHQAAGSLGSHGGWSPISAGGWGLGASPPDGAVAAQIGRNANRV